MSRKPARSPRAAGSPAALILAAVTALTGAVLVVFWPVLQGQFIYDSVVEIVQWDWLRDPHHILTAVSFRLMSMDVLDFNRPVTVAWLMFNAWMWGLSPWGYHLTDILLHLLNTLAVFLLIRKILGQVTPGRDPARRTFNAFLGALLFALHPLVTETVCEPSNSKDLLAMLFMLTGLLLAARHRPGGLGPGDPARLLLCPFLALLAVGSKEVGVAFCLVLLAYWLIFRRREPAGYWIAIVASSAIVTLLFLIARFSLAHHPSEVFVVQPKYPANGLAQTIFTIQPRIFTLYLTNLFWPLNLCADYTGYSVRNFPLWLSYLVVLSALGGLAWWSWRDRRVLFGFIFLVATLLPVSNFVPIYHPAADRYLYGPLSACALLLAVVLDSRWLASRPVRQGMAAWAVVFAFGLLVPVTLNREGVWSTELALWTDTAERNPNSLTAMNNLPEALMQQQHNAEARQQTERALRLNPAWPGLWVDYAIELKRLGLDGQAESAARHAIELKPDLTDIEKMVSTLQYSRGEMDEFDRISDPAIRAK